MRATPEPQSPYSRDQSRGTDHVAAGRQEGRTSSPGRVTQGCPSRIKLNVCSSNSRPVI